jgi:hypothetical protein
MPPRLRLVPDFRQALATGTSRTWTGRWSRHLRAPAFNSLYWTDPAGTVLIANIVGQQIDVVGHGRFVKLPEAMPANSLGIAW